MHDEERGRAEDLIRNMIRLIGDVPDREGLVETPRRVVNSWNELFRGYREDPRDLLKTFDESFSGMVLAKGIKFYSTCEHHILPFSGEAHIAYIPAGGKVIGASKLNRLLEVFSRRLQIQERIAEQVVDSLMRHINPAPLGAACLIQAHHLCMLCRGVKNDQSFVTVVYRGSFLTDMNARNEFLHCVSINEK